jgi:hypothetical protein
VTGSVLDSCTKFHYSWFQLVFWYTSSLSVMQSNVL